MYVGLRKFFSNQELSWKLKIFPQTTKSLPLPMICMHKFSTNIFTNMNNTVFTLQPFSLPPPTTTSSDAFYSINLIFMHNVVHLCWLTKLTKMLCFSAIHTAAYTHRDKERNLITLLSALELTLEMTFYMRLEISMYFKREKIICRFCENAWEKNVVKIL